MARTASGRGGSPSRGQLSVLAPRRLCGSRSLSALSSPCGGRGAGSLAIWGSALAHLAGIGLAVEVAGTQHVGADVGPIHLWAAALVVCDQGDQRLPQGAGVATHICGRGALRLGAAPWGWPRLPWTRCPLPHSLSSWWPQPAIWHLCPAGKGLLGSGRQIGWTNWERTAQRSPFFFSRIKTGQERDQRSAQAMGVHAGAEGLWPGRPGLEQESWPRARQGWPARSSSRQAKATLPYQVPWLPSPPPCPSPSVSPFLPLPSLPLFPSPQVGLMPTPASLLALAWGVQSTHPWPCCIPTCPKPYPGHGHWG